MSRARRGGRWMAFLLVLLAMLGLSSVAMPFLLTPPAALDLALVDPVLDTPLTDAAVSLTDLARDKTLVLPVQATPAGYSVRVPRIRSGDSRVEVVVEGFEPAVVDIRAEPLSVVRETATLTPMFGQLAVSAINARLPDVPVDGGLEVRAGDHEATGEGEVLFTRLPPADYTVEAAATGFCGGVREATVRRGRRTELVMPLPPEMVAGERLRMILDWGANPRDLDAHVLLSESSVPLARDHIYFAKKKGGLRDGGLWAELDVDWQRSESFETITAYDRADGVYQYFVHKYAGSGSIGSSGARVELFTAGCRRQKVAVQSSCDQEWWYVADIKVAGEDVHLVERNTCQERMPHRWDLRPKPTADGP